MNTENTLTAVRGEGMGLGDKGEGIKQRTKRLLDTNCIMVIARGQEGEWGGKRRVKEG